MQKRARHADPPSDTVCLHKWRKREEWLGLNKTHTTQQHTVPSQNRTEQNRTEMKEEALAVQEEPEFVEQEHCNTEQDELRIVGEV